VIRTIELNNGVAVPQLGLGVFHVDPSRIRENIDVFDFTMSADDVRAISDLDRHSHKPSSRMSEAVIMMPTWTS
jgi:diketogulonate reductase-like aldo/keto reductase